MTTLKGVTVGVIGLGFLGKPMSRNLKKAGAEVVIHNRSRAVVDELAAEGLKPATSGGEVARRADAVILLVTDTPAVELVLLGEGGVLEGLRPGGLVIDMGTTAVMKTRDFAKDVEAAGGVYVDAPVSGGQVGAVAGNLTIMAGGTEAAFTRARPFFEVLGERITHVGDIGAGQIAKAANQVIVGLTIGAVAEAFTLARAAGVDPALVREALQGGFASSRILELHGERMAKRDFEGGGHSTTQLKDMVQALDLAEALGIELPATALNRDLYQRMVDRGLGELDHSGLIRVYEPD